MQLTGADVPESLRVIDFTHLAGKIRRGEKLPAHQADRVIEYVRYGFGRVVLDSDCQAYTLNELRRRHAAGTLRTGEGRPLDDAALLARLEQETSVVSRAEALATPAKRGPRATAGEAGDRPRMSVDRCVQDITDALRKGNTDFAVTHAEDAVKIYADTPSVLYMAAIAYAHAAAKNAAAEVADRMADHKRSIELFDQCLRAAEGIPCHADLRAKALAKRLEVLPMIERLEVLKRKREGKG